MSDPGTLEVSRRTRPCYRQGGRALIDNSKPIYVLERANLPANVLWRGHAEVVWRAEQSGGAKPRSPFIGFDQGEGKPSCRKVGRLFIYGVIKEIRKE